MRTDATRSKIKEETFDNVMYQCIVANAIHVLLKLTFHNV